MENAAMTTHASPAPPQPHSKRSGSQKRIRQHKIPVACNDEEFCQIDDRAHEVGLSRPSYLRACAIGAPGPRARRSPPVNAEALGKAIAALNKVGSNLNQIAHGLNAGGGFSLVLQECFAALAEVRAAAASIRAVVMERDRP
jgi:hypothetical protein